MYLQRQTHYSASCVIALKGVSAGRSMLHQLTNFTDKQNHDIRKSKCTQTFIQYVINHYRIHIVIAALV